MEPTDRGRDETGEAAAAAARLARILRERLLLDRSFGLETAGGWRLAAGARIQETGPASDSLREPQAAVGEPRAASRQPPAAPAVAKRPEAPEELAGERRRRQALLDPIHLEVRSCKACVLCEERTQAVFGVGDPCARLLFIGEGPGEDEDRQGEPFVGKAGQLLTRMIQAMGLSRKDVYIANIVKCRPPGNRTPAPREVISCLPYLRRQIEVIDPDAICVLGNVAARSLLGSQVSISRLRGRFTRYREIPVMPTFHPSYLLRNPVDKRLVWEDLRKLMAFLGLPDPPPSRESPGRPADRS